MLVPSWELDLPKIIAYEAWDHQRTYQGMVRRGEVTPEESLAIFAQRVKDKIAELTEDEE